MDRPRTQRRNETLRTAVTGNSYSYKDKTVWHRPHLQRVRIALRYIREFGDKGASTTRVMYRLSGTWAQMPPFLDWMEERGLIKLRATQYYERANTAFYICITKKGIMLLELLDEHAKMIPTAPWLEENTGTSATVDLKKLEWNTE